LNAEIDDVPIVVNNFLILIKISYRSRINCKIQYKKA